MNTTSETQKWSRISVYSDMCLQTVQRAMSHLVTVFQMKLKMLTDTGKYLLDLFWFIRLSVFCISLFLCFQLSQNLPGWDNTKVRSITIFYFFSIITFKENGFNKFCLFLESVTFSESDAGEDLFISESGTRMKYSNKAKSLTKSDGPLRFYFSMTLGTKGFTSGRHYWEVQVGLRNDWNVGVALGTVDRSSAVVVKTENGFFSIAKMGFDYYANETPKKVLYLCPRPGRIGVYLDYEEGRVFQTFYLFHIQNYCVIHQKCVGVFVHEMLKSACSTILHSEAVRCASKQHRNSCPRWSESTVHP